MSTITDSTRRFQHGENPFVSFFQMDTTLTYLGDKGRRGAQKGGENGKVLHGQHDTFSITITQETAHVELNKPRSS